MNRSLRIMVLAAGVLVMGTGVAMAKPDKPADMTPAMCAPQAAFQNLAPEKQQLFRTIMQEHQDRMGPMRDQLKVKRMELKALSGNPNTQPDTISKLTAEIGDIMGKLRTERTALRVKLEKEVGFAPMMNAGYHDGYRGHGGHGGKYNRDCPGMRG